MSGDRKRVVSVGVEDVEPKIQKKTLGVDVNVSENKGFSPQIIH